MTDQIRVLHIVTTMNRGGLETMLMNYYRHIDRTKVQFDFLVHRDVEADYDQEITQLGGKIYHVSRLVPWSKKYQRELKSFFKQHPEYKIVHVHQDCLSSVALKCAKACGVSVRIAHSHSSSAVKNIKYPIKIHYMKQIPKYATHMFACGKQAGDWMFSFNQYAIVRNAIDIERYRYLLDVDKKVRDEWQLGDHLVIGHVGNFTEAKNHKFLLEVFQEILKRVPEARLLLVGGGERQEVFMKKVNDLGIQKNVIFTGVRSDVNELLQAMNVFVFPSLYEGLPVTLVEAQTSGLPCVISDRISDECIISANLVSSMSLDDTAGQWAERILQLSTKKREDHSTEIKEAGYDITTAATQLESFYLEEAERK